MTPYLILHKVRNKPAFDIAIPLKIGSEDGWIIPTSGHRAYPYWSVPLNKVYLDEERNSMCIIPIPLEDVTALITIPSPWPDHYPCNDQKRAPSIPTETLSLDEIGL